MTKNTIATLSAFAAAAFIGSSAYAGTPVKAKDNKAPKEVAKESCITGDLGVDFTSNYISRGVPQENQGVIAQPYVDLYFKIYEGSGALTKATVNLSTWSSVHDHNHFAATTSAWYEFDYAAGITLQFGKLSITPSFLAILSPNDAFADNYNANINIAYDDSDLLGKFALHPHATVMFEIDGKAGTGDEEGVYYEFGIAPGFQAGPVAISIPINLGLGSSGFYGDPRGKNRGDDTFGYFSAGVAAEYPLHFLPECLGQWALKANATYYRLGDNTSEVRSVVDGDQNQWSFGGGVVVRF